jgi:hypothetical protein
MNRPIEEKKKVLMSLLNEEIGISQACTLLAVTRRSVERYRKKFLLFGEAGLIDKRHSNYSKLKESDRVRIIGLKKADPWRSARNIRDELRLKVTEHQVERIIVKSGLGKQNLKRVKAIIRFEARYPNELWQTDIQGKIGFPAIGILYLIATLDDHSRFCLAGRWFMTQGKMNVFQIWYEALARFGVPDKILQDEGSQYKARTRFGLADYGWYAKEIGIELIWAHKAETKGKIERFWRFVQTDFVPGVIQAKSVEEVNGAFRIWLAKYNYVFKSRYFGNCTHWSKYKPSQKRLTAVELYTLLVVEERRKVTRESTISLYGKHYFVPPGYIGCHIWIKVRGNKLYFESNNQTFWKTKLRF